MTNLHGHVFPQSTGHLFSSHVLRFERTSPATFGKLNSTIEQGERKTDTTLPVAAVYPGSSRSYRVAYRSSRASYVFYNHHISSNILIGWPVGYSVLAFDQRIKTKVEPKTFINALDPLLRQMKKRPGVVYLKRLTIVLDEDSEKGFGLVRSHFPNHPTHIANTRCYRQTRSRTCLVLTTSSHLHQPPRVASRLRA